MKKLICLIVTLISFVTVSFAQLNVKSSTSKDDILAKDYYCTLRNSSTGYELIVSDKLQKTNATLSIFLGDTKESALLTLTDIYNFFDKSENKSSIIIEDKISGEELTLFKYGQGSYLITNGDAEYARRSLNQAIMGQTIGWTNQRNNGSLPIVGYVTAKVMRKGIAILNQ